MAKNYPTLKKIVSLFFFLFAISTFSQTTGDFRSKASGPSNWTDISSWQTYNGTAWVDATSYPGQNAGTGAVLIQFGHSITLSSAIITQNFGDFNIAGRLVINGDNSAGGMDFTVNTNKIYVAPSPNGGFIEFNNKLNLRLPETASFIVSNGGLDVSSGCSANQIIYIGSTAYSNCNGGGQLPNFTDLMQGGGTLSANPTSNSPVCIGNSIVLSGGYTGVVGTTTSGGTPGVNYAWEITYPDNFKYFSTFKDLSISATQNGIYSATLTCTTYFGVTLSTNYKSISVSVNTNTWNGSLNEDWNNPANWSCGVIPTINTDVLIPSPLETGKKFPIISAGDPRGYVRHIEVQNGASITIAGVTAIGTGNAITIAGNLTLNGKIDLNGESQLVQGTGSNLFGTGTIEIDQQGEGNKYRYNYWSMPVYTANDNDSKGNFTTILASLRDGTIPSSPGIINFSNSGYDGALTTPITLSTYWMYKYANSGNGYSAWDQVRSTGKIYTGEGFIMKGPGTPDSPAQNYTFVGKPNNGTINLTVAKNYDYLVGNPYPSAIDADQFILENALSITGAIYYWEHYGGDTHNLSGYQGGYATYSYGGGTPASSFPGLGGGSSVKGAPGQYIPVGQAFFVVGEAFDGGQIQFNNGQRIFVKEGATSIFMKTSNTKLKTENSLGKDLRPKFRIGFDAPKISHRQLLLTIDERATPAVDWGFDAEIYEIFADDMYWMLNNKKYVIQATNSLGLNSEVPLGIQLSKTGVAIFKIDALENVDDDTSVYLKDKVTGESFNMREKPVALNLVAGKYADRFVLVFKTQKLMAEDVKAEISIPAAAQPIIEGIHVFMINATGELQIKNNSPEEILSVALVNTLGQTVKTWNSNFNVRTISLPISAATGVYLVQITTKTGKTVKKISVE